MTQTLEQTVDEHCRAGTFDVVTRAGLETRVHDVIPSFVCLVLRKDDGVCEALQVFQKSCAARVLLGEVVESVNERHDVPVMTTVVRIRVLTCANTCSCCDSPSDSTAPNMRRRASHRISPDLCLRYIESMKRKSIGAVAVNCRSCIDEVKLQCDIVPGCSVAGLKFVRPTRVEDIEHVNAIEPHLAILVSLCGVPV